MQRLALYENSTENGTLTRVEDGLHSVFTAQCRDGQGVRKVWLRSEGGGSLLLGTLLPQNGCWGLRRRISHSELVRNGMTGEIWGEIAGMGSEPSSRQNGTRLPFVPKDAVIADALRQEKGYRCKREGDHWRISIPWQVGQPVPLLPLFCFACAGRGELIYLLDEQGFPMEDV